MRRAVVAVLALARADAGGTLGGATARVADSSAAGAGRLDVIHCYGVLELVGGAPAQGWRVAVLAA